MTNEPQFYDTCFGIDLSLVETGLCYLAPDGTYESLLIKTNKMFDRLDRYFLIASRIVNFIEERPKTLICIEGYSMGSHGMNFNLGEIGGIVRYQFHMLGYHIVECPPATLKKFTTGNGRAQKNQMKEAVRTKYGCRLTNDNAVDAFALAKFGLTVRLKE